MLNFYAKISTGHSWLSSNDAPEICGNRPLGSCAKPGWYRMRRSRKSPCRSGGCQWPSIQSSIPGGRPCFIFLRPGYHIRDGKERSERGRPEEPPSNMAVRCIRSQWASATTDCLITSGGPPPRGEKPRGARVPRS